MAHSLLRVSKVCGTPRSLHPHIRLLYLTCHLLPSPSPGDIPLLCLTIPSTIIPPRVALPDTSRHYSALRCRACEDQVRARVCRDVFD